MNSLGITLGIVVAAALLGVGGVTLFQRALLYQPSSKKVAPDVPGVAAVRITTGDGESLVAWWLPPPPGGIVFLFLDGNGGAPELWGDRWRAIAGAEAGFLAVYYRGYSGSSGHPTENGLHMDASAGFDWLIAQGVKPRQIVIDGFSLGSGVAVRLASGRPARALILEAPFTSAADVAAGNLPFLPVHWLMWDQFRSRDLIGKVRMPILIAHGDRDSVIPFRFGEELFALAPEPKTFARMRGSDHMTLVKDGVFHHIWAFLALHPQTGVAGAGP
jgi:fermentation-respiration switch protein FrsA (DUF1100 family)